MTKNGKLTFCEDPSLPSSFSDMGLGLRRNYAGRLRLYQKEGGGDTTYMYDVCTVRMYLLSLLQTPGPGFY